MAIDRSEDRSFAEILAQQVAEVENSEQIARLLIARFRTISEILGPVIGSGGVAALFERSFYLASDIYPWTTDLQIHTDAEKAFSAIELLFASQPAPEAANVGMLIISQFCDLLAGMVGYSLSEKLLRPVLIRSISDLAVNGNSDE